jgi:hypothetical protein
MAVTAYTLAELITDVYYRRYARNASEASNDERAQIVRFAEFHAREYWKMYHWFFGLKTDTTLTVSSTNKVVLPSDCEDNGALKLTQTASEQEISYTQRYAATPELTVLETGLETTGVTLEYRTQEPTYVAGTETTTIHPCLFNGLVLAVIGELWGGDQQKADREYWLGEANKAILRAIDAQERQRGLKKRPKIRTYSRGR